MNIPALSTYARFALRSSSCPIAAKISWMPCFWLQIDHLQNIWTYWTRIITEAPSANPRLHKYSRLLPPTQLTGVCLVQFAILNQPSFWFLTEAARKFWWPCTLICRHLFNDVICSEDAKHAKQRGCMVLKVVLIIRCDNPCWFNAALADLLVYCEKS